MPIDLTNFKVVYKGELIPNCIECDACIRMGRVDEHDKLVEESKVEGIRLIYLDKSNRMQVKEDRAEEFQFLRK